jgi:hypothetical protein
LVSAASFSKQDLIALDLATECFLHELKSTGNHFAWSKEGRFKGKLKKLIEILQEKYSLAEKSKLQFFVHLGYRVYIKRDDIVFCTFCHKNRKNIWALFPCEN